MNTLLNVLVVTGLLSGYATAGEKHWETARIVSHNLQRLMWAGDKKPADTDVLVIDTSDQRYTLGRVTGWSGNNTKMADLPPQYIKVYREWGAVPLAQAVRDQRARGVLNNPSYYIRVLDTRGKQVAYAVMAIGEPGKPKEEIPIAQAKESDSSVVSSGADHAQVSATACGTGSACAPSGKAGALLGIEITTSEQGGIKVLKITPNGPAAQANFHVGDVIISIDGKAITTPAGLETALVNHQPGSTVRVGYLFHTNLGWTPGTERTLTLAAEDK